MMSLKLDYFKLFASCVSVNGVVRSTICDLQRNKVYFISNELKEVLDDCEKLKVSEVLRKHNYESSEVLEELDILCKNELGFWHDDPDKFPRISSDWSTPEKINNAILEVTNSNIGLTLKFIKECNLLGCKHYEFWIENSISKENLISIFDEMKISKVRSVKIIQKYVDTETILLFDQIVIENQRLLSILIHSVDQSELDGFLSDNLQSKGVISLTEEKISKYSCGVISQDYFVSGIDTYTESINHNSCLNKKISMDTHGNIKNCVSMSHNFGNIRDKNLLSVVNDKDFTYLWNISKNEIEKCKECEFRFVCTDCRAYLEEPQNILSKPLKCGYNPNTAEWEDWKKQEQNTTAIEYYNLG